MADSFIESLFNDNGVRIDWNKDNIEKALRYMVEQTGQKTLPTHAETKKFYGNYKLSNAMRRNGGPRYWGERMNLEFKDCESRKGEQFEDYFVAEMLEKGFDAERVNYDEPRFPFDVLINGCVKVDVKVARVFGSDKQGYYSFNLEHKKHSCDFFVCYCLDSSGENIVKTYIIPSSVMDGKSQLGVGLSQSKYDAYIGRYDLIGQTCEFYDSLNLVKSFAW